MAHASGDDREPYSPSHLSIFPNRMMSDRPRNQGTQGAIVFLRIASPRKQEQAPMSQLQRVRKAKCATCPFGDTENLVEAW